MQILEEVCKKYPEFKAENHELRRNNKAVDLNQHFRFSALPNNCTLEMYETDKKRIEEAVMICLQLEDNTRLNGNHLPSKTLREIINEMCPEKSTDSPILIYMRSEIYGDALDNTTLKSLGVFSGRALLRLINSNPESLKVQANVSAPLPQKPRLELAEPVKPKQRTDVNEAGPSSAFQFKNVEQLKEKLVAQPAEEKMEIEEEKTAEEVKTIVENPSIVEEAPLKDSFKVPEIPAIVNILDDRGTIIFSLDSIQTESMDLPDSFFELTENDVRVLYRELRKTVNSNENKPLMTEGLRKLEENKKILNQLAAYKNCAVRIQLPDRHVIQTKFSTVEKIGAVKEFLKTFLINPEIEFYLFVTPPKKILDNELTLIESNCVPSALLHFGSEEKFTELLKPEYYQKLSTRTEASKVLLSNKSADVVENQPGTSSKSTTSVPSNFMESKATSKPTGTVPKWFKPSK